MAHHSTYVSNTSETLSQTLLRSRQAVQRGPRWTKGGDAVTTKIKLQNYHSATFKWTKNVIHPLQPSCDAQDAAICWQVDQMGHTSHKTPSSTFAFKYCLDYSVQAPTRTRRGNQVTPLSDANYCPNYCCASRANKFRAWCPLAPRLGLGAPRCTAQFCTLWNAQCP